MQKNMTLNINSFSKTMMCNTFPYKAADVFCMNLILKHQPLIIQEFPSYYYSNKA